MDTLKELLDALSKKNWILVAVLAMEIAAKILRSRVSDPVLAMASLPPLDDLGSLSMDELTGRFANEVKKGELVSMAGGAEISPIWLPIILAIIRKVLQNI